MFSVITSFVALPLQLPVMWGPVATSEFLWVLTSALKTSGGSSECGSLLIVIMLNRTSIMSCRNYNGQSLCQSVTRMTRTYRAFEHCGMTRRWHRDCPSVNYDDMYVHLSVCLSVCHPWYCCYLNQSRWFRREMFGTVQKTLWNCPSIQTEIGRGPPLQSHWVQGAVLSGGGWINFGMGGGGVVVTWKSATDANCTSGSTFHAIDWETVSLHHQKQLTTHFNSIFILPPSTAIKD